MLLQEFELLLVHKHRFALTNVILCMQRITDDLILVQRALSSVSASSTTSLERVFRCLEGLVTLVPSFLGERELATFVDALQEFNRVAQALESQPKLQEALLTLGNTTNALMDAATRDAATCAQLTRKRDHLATLLAQTEQVLQNSHLRRSQQYQDTIQHFMAEFQSTLKDEHLQLAKQLRFDIETIETSMLKMLQPHFEICKTITIANARVQWTESTFSKIECKDISVFVQTAAKLETGDTTFHSVLQDTTQFLAQVSLFEQAASKDAFLVCSSALKLQFRERLDQELFLAYMKDWSEKHKTLQLTESSNEFKAATDLLQNLKVAIGRAHELAQISREKVALDIPARESLAKEVARIFHEEGGHITQFDLPECA
ncbi:unnamed protein product [Peronospora effusa]|nr:unnamed protein product [Peronospora effusa]